VLITKDYNDNDNPVSLCNNSSTCMYFCYMKIYMSPLHFN